MLQEFYDLSPDFIESDMSLIPYYCGIEECRPGHFYGPAVRDHFLIHYVLSGKGLFQVGGREYVLEKGQGFLICPNIVTYYKADTDEPWTYEWVGFYGLNAGTYLKCANLDIDNPIFTYDRDDALNDCFKQMFKASSMKKGRDIKLQSLIYLFVSLLVETAGDCMFDEKPMPGKDLYVKKAVEFICINYSRSISISEIAHHIGLDRKYFSSVFKNTLKVTPREFLINYRMDKACELMKNSMLSISEISRSVGYDDPLLFSKMFKKNKGESPGKFRKALYQTTFKPLQPL
jgi:AraC-like DNA-binding protein